MRKALVEIPAGRLVLDLPFGTGRFAAHYEAGSHRVIGIDVSGDMLRHAFADSSVRRVPLLAVQGEGEHVPLRDGAVDYAVCTRFLNWLPAAVQATVLGELRRVTRHGAFVQARVAERLSLGAYVRALAAEALGGPGRTARRLGRGLRRGAMTLASRGIGASFGRSAPRFGQDTGGYAVPSADEIERLMRASRWIPESAVTLQEQVVFRARVKHAVRLYRLKPR